MESDCAMSPFRKIEHAISLRQVANHLYEGMDTKSDSTLFHGMYLAVPVLMSLAVEIGLKALKCQEGKEGFEREHDLVKLFQSLNKETQSHLKERLPETLDKVSSRLGVQEFFPAGAEIEKVLEYHQNTFRDWRYLYEKKGSNACFPTELDKVLTAIIETYEEKVAEESISKND